MIALSSMDGQYLSVNDAFLQTLGYSREEVIGRSATELGQWISAEHRQSVVETLLREGTVRGVEMVLSTKSGELRHGLASARLTRLDNQQVILSMVTDFTERKRMEIDLRASELRFRSLFGAAPLGLAIINLHGEFEEINPTLELLLGYRASELLGQHFQIIVHPEDSDYVLSLHKEQIAGQLDICRATCRMLTKTGEERWARCLVSLVRSEDGRPTYLLGIIENVTEQRLAVQEVQRLAAIVSSSDDAIISTDLEGRITSWNPSAERIYGYTVEEACGEPIGMIIHPDSDQHEEIWRKLLLGEHINHFEALNLRKDGSTVSVVLTISTLFDHGKMIGATSICRDITARKQLEQEMARLDRLNLVGEMAAGISHEVRNPMTTVRGYLQLLGQKPELAGYKEYFNLMIDELDRSNSIISEFLSLGSVKAVDLQPYDLNGVVRALAPLIEADAMVHGHELRLQLAPSPAVMLDAKEIRQLILNLVRNGFDAMQNKGSLTIRTSVEAEDVILLISDEGCGIPEALQDKIGTPFFTTKDGGTGLGLPVCYSIAARHHAHMSFTSVQGGTTFRVRFPARLL